MRAFYAAPPTYDFNGTEHQRTVAVLTATWKLPALIEACHHLLLWTLEPCAPLSHKPNNTTTEWINNCWQAEFTTGYFIDTNLSLQFYSAWGNVKFELHEEESGRANQDRNRIYTHRKFNGQKFYAECLTSISGFLVHLAEIDVKEPIWTDLKPSKVQNVMRKLGLVSPFPTVELPNPLYSQYYNKIRKKLC